MSTKNIDLRVGRQGSWIVVAKGAGPNPRELFRLSADEAHSFGTRLIEMARTEVKIITPVAREVFGDPPKVVK